MKLLFYAFSAMILTSCVYAMQEHSLLALLPAEMKLRIAQQLIKSSELVPRARQDYISLATTDRSWRDLCQLHQERLITSVSKTFSIHRSVAQYFFSPTREHRSLQAIINELSFDQKKQLFAFAIRQSLCDGTKDERVFLLRRIVPAFSYCIICSCCQLRLITRFEDALEHVSETIQTVSSDTQSRASGDAQNANRWTFGGYSAQHGYYIIRCDLPIKE